jgi:hypothetical protein
MSGVKILTEILLIQLSYAGKQSQNSMTDDKNISDPPVRNTDDKNQRTDRAK